MADAKPLKIASGQVQQFGSGDTVPVANGGTGADQSAIAKGGLLVGTAAATIGIKAVGADGQVLTADAASSGGVKWAAAGGSEAAANTRMRAAFFNA